MKNSVRALLSHIHYYLRGRMTSWMFLEESFLRKEVIRCSAQVESWCPVRIVLGRKAEPEARRTEEQAKG
ncbi:MAG: hypothetical protein ACRBG0_05175 [Lewinella sp.]|uniref:hypothetical protein n=1 Tax=Lewinella sp. TaxID=2004506 RepID=UPI003D6A8126